MLGNFWTLILIRKWRDFACSSARRKNVMGTPTCLSTYTVNDIGAHQYRLCTQLRTETPLLFIFADFQT